MTALAKIRFFFFKNLEWKHVFPIFILGMVDMFVFLGPLYLRNVFPNPQDFFRISKSEFDMMTSIWGYVAVVLYFPSGWLADKFSNKKLVIISALLTSVLVVWWTTLAKFKADGAMAQLGIIYALWGVSTTLTFWAPLWRLLSQQVDKDDQGTAYGLQGSFNGLFGFIFVTIIGYFLLEYNSDFMTLAGFSIFGYTIAIMLFIGAVLTYFYCREHPIKTDAESRFSFKKLGKVLSSGRIWLAAIMVNGIYFMQHELAYLVPFMKNIIGVSGVITVLIAGGRTYAARMLIAQPVGRIGDRAKSFIFLLTVGLTIALGLVLVILFLPGIGGNFLLDHGAARTMVDPKTGLTCVVFEPGSASKWVIFVQATICVVIILLGVLTWFLVTLRFAQVAELPTPKNSYGTVVGFISLIAFSSNGWFNTLASVVEDRDPLRVATLNSDGTIKSVSEVANQASSELIITILVCVALIGAICGWVLYFWTKTINKRKGNAKKFERELNN